MLVQDIMNRRVITASQNETVALASRLLSRYNIGSVPICTDDGRLRGIVTDRDITLRCVAVGSDPESTSLKEIMTRNIQSVSPKDDIAKAAKIMSENKVRRLPVVENSKIVGVLSLGDLAQRQACHIEASNALTDISSNIKKDNLKINR